MDLEVDIDPEVVVIAKLALGERQCGVEISEQAVYGVHGAKVQAEAQTEIDFVCYQQFHLDAQMRHVHEYANFAAVFCLGLVHALVVHFGQGVQLLAQVFVVFAAFLVLELAYGFQTQELWSLAKTRPPSLQECDSSTLRHHGKVQARPFPCSH